MKFSMYPSKAKACREAIGHTAHWARHLTPCIIVKNPGSSRNIPAPLRVFRRVLARNTRRMTLQQQRTTNNGSQFYVARITPNNATRMSSTSVLAHRSQRLAVVARVARIALAIMAVMLFALGVLSVMALEKFNSSLNDVTESRIGVIAFDVQDNIEQGLALGINLQALQNVQDTIRRAQGRDVKISAIYVIGKQGETLYRVPDAAPDLSGEAVEKFRKARGKGPLSSFREGNFLNAFTNLQNSFSQTVGILLIKYDASSLAERYAAFRALFFRQVLIFLFAGTAIATVAVWLLLTRFDAADAALAASLDFDTSAEIGGGETRHGEFAAFKAKESEALTAIAAAEKLLGLK